MSAIFGILYLDTAMAAKKHLQMMQKVIGHYGTDAQDTLLLNHIGLGCCLHRISPHAAKDSPIYYDREQDCILIGDALIYNREKLMDMLGLKDKEQVSTQELLLRAYYQWGEKCPDYLNGDFTFAIWEKGKNRLLLVRDHLGVRPLYYYSSTSVFAFATDYRALLALPFVGRQLDEVRLYAILSDTYHIDTECTCFAQIKRLPQAHLMYIDGKGIRKSKYWTPGKGKKIFHQREEEYAKELYSLIEDAITIRLKETSSDIASEFSGGLDSSVITVIAHRALQKEGRKLLACSWSPAYELMEKQKEDEREYISLICKKEGFPCSFLAFNLKPEQELARRAVLTDGQRSEGLQQVLQEIHSHDLEAIFSGWGGDEGISHRADLYELLFSGDIGYFFREAYYLSRDSFLRFIKLLALIPVTLLKRPYSYFGKQDHKVPRIMKADYAKRLRKYCKRDILYLRINPAKHIEAGASVSRTELTAWIGADYHIQYLFPFLDRRVVDYAMLIPRHWYYKKGTSRYIYRKAFEKLLPKDMCRKRGKIDYAREKYWKKKEDLQKKAEILVTLIDKEMFSQYIDWDRVTELIRQNFFARTSRESIFTLYKLQVCYDIQRILAETEAEDGTR